MTEKSCVGSSKGNEQEIEFDSHSWFSFHIRFISCFLQLVWDWEQLEQDPAHGSFLRQDFEPFLPQVLIDLLFLPNLEKTKKDTSINFRQSNKVQKQMTKQTKTINKTCSGPPFMDLCSFILVKLVLLSWIQHHIKTMLYHAWKASNDV